MQRLSRYWASFIIKKLVNIPYKSVICLFYRQNQNLLIYISKSITIYILKSYHEVWGDDMVTERDMRVLELLTQLRYATTRQLKDTIFNDVSYSVAYRRLKYLSGNKLINRKYYNIDKNTNSHVYYLDRAPSRKNITHELLISQFIVELSKLELDILEVGKGQIYHGIKPDLIVRIRTKAGNKRIIFLEIQLSKHNCINKYFNLYKGDIPAILYVATNNKIESPQIRGMRVIIDDLNFKKLQFYFS